MGSFLEAFQYTFMRYALVGSLLTGALCSFLSVYIVLRRIVFVGVALAQLSSAGVALAFLFGATPFLLASLPLAFVFAGVAALGGLQVGAMRAKLPQESIVGAAYAIAMASGILLLSKGPGEAHVLELLTGNVLAISRGDLLFALSVFIPVALILGLFHKEFVFTSFDREMAAALGIRVGIWDALFFLSLGAVIAAAIRLVGVLLEFTYLVVPGMSALLLSRRLRAAFPLAVLFGIIPSILGLYLSYVFDLPTGPTITACAVGLLLLCWGLGRMRR